MCEQGTDRNYELSQQDEAPAEISQAQLRARGWTDTMIRKLLREPDERREHTASPEQPPLNLYFLRRIQEAERTDAFSELLRKSEKRKAAADITQKTRRSNTMSQVEGLEIKLPKLEKKELVELGCAHYNAWLKAIGIEREWVTPRSSVRFRSFVSVQFLLASVEGYQELYNGLLGQVGAKGGQRRLNERIYQVIAQMYPQLASMCEQLNKRKLFPFDDQKLAREQTSAARKGDRTRS